MPPVGKQNDPCHQPDKNVTNLICDSTEARYQAPKARKITGVRLELSDCEGESSSHQPTSAKRKRSAGPSGHSTQGKSANSQNKESETEFGVREAICTAVQEYVACIADAVKDI